MKYQNSWVKFRRLLQVEGRYVVTVQSNNGDATSILQNRDGTTITVKGKGVAATKKAMIEDGPLSYEVPALTTWVIDV